jgi:glutamate racemase
MEQQTMKTACSDRIYSHFRAWVFLLGLLLGMVTLPANAQSESTPAWLPGLLEKESITIVVTDSGLGGLSVVADAAEKFRKHPVFKEVELVFVNALFSDQGGYNSLQTRDEKLRVFSNALQAMQDRYAPDIIMVACNTLSVLIPDTSFVSTTDIPVVGIVETGVEQIAQQLQGETAGKNIIFATQTTVDEGTHKDQLVKMGLGDEQILTQSCPQLTLYIEQEYDGAYTEMLIDAYVDEALSGMGEIDGPLSVSFNCTHFGYSLDFWKQAFESRGVKVEAFLDPNLLMVDFLLPASLQQRYPQTQVSVKAVSMIDIPQGSQESIGRYLAGISPMTENALRNYQQVEDLFEWRVQASAAEE